ncbi:hypothetical protein H5410_011021 [Solanum commersonii]|uniref:Cupin type-1 domain-containing protein n=1 Tax=Solanum commersonii TaxID=4109 RepID=A0A9J6ANG4_SOLCO|nr:hypothetical protein H5410_011021 [Solanum commersonii]
MKNELFTKILHPGDVFVFPIGLIHFQFNFESREVKSDQYFQTEGVQYMKTIDQHTLKSECWTQEIRKQQDEQELIFSRSNFTREK